MRPVDEQRAQACNRGAEGKETLRQTRERGLIKGAMYLQWVGIFGWRSKFEPFEILTHSLFDFFAFVSGDLDEEPIDVELANALFFAQSVHRKFERPHLRGVPRIEQRGQQQPLRFQFGDRCRQLPPCHACAAAAHTAVHTQKG